MSDLFEIITRRQDELRGRPRNWRDDLSSWWVGVHKQWLAFCIVCAAWLFGWAIFIVTKIDWAA